MAKYDFQSAKRFVQMHADQIDHAMLGMQEDWFWTAETIFEDGRFSMDLDDTKEINGIDGSKWATPSLYLKYKNGVEEMKDCYEGSVGGDCKKPEWFELGVLSSPNQEWVETVKRPKLTN